MYDNAATLASTIFVVRYEKLENEKNKKKLLNFELNEEISFSLKIAFVQNKFIQFICFSLDSLSLSLSLLVIIFDQLIQSKERRKKIAEKSENGFAIIKSSPGKKILIASNYSEQAKNLV